MRWINGKSSQTKFLNMYKRLEEAVTGKMMEKQKLKKVNIVTGKT